MLGKVLSAPKFISLGYPTLKNEVVWAKLTPTDKQFIDIYLTTRSCGNPDHADHRRLPKLQVQSRCVKKCNHPKCVTCKYNNFLHQQKPMSPILYGTISHAPPKT